MTLASDGMSLVGLWFHSQKHFASTLSADHVERDDVPVFDEAKHWLDDYFSGRILCFTPMLAFRATSFQRRVWEILLTIPYGETMTYGEIAHIVAKQNGRSAMSARAVGGAVGHNPISLIVPCHRVVGADGRLTGYAGGVERKAHLIRMEKDNLSKTL